MNNEIPAAVILMSRSPDSQEWYLKTLATSCESIKAIGQRVDFITFFNASVDFAE